MLTCVEVATFGCTEEQVRVVKQNLVDRLEKIRQSEKEMGKTQKERAYHAAFDTFVELIMEKQFKVSLYVCMCAWYVFTECCCSDPSLAYKGTFGQKKSKVLIPDAGVGLRYAHSKVRTRS